ncbi:hypothetical protein RHS03_02416, partial [Rhizoctonia solani]
MGYSLGQLGEQHLSDQLLLGITNVDDPGNIDFFSWIDETRLESDVSLEDPSREQMSSATDQNLPLHSSSIHSQQERSYRTEPLDYPRIPTEAHSAQEYNRYDYQTPCYVDFEETNKVTVATTAAPPRLPESPPGLLVPPERPFTPSSAWIPVYLPNAPNQYYGGLMYTYDTVHHYLQHPDALLYWSTGLLVQADETPGFSIEPSQMHLNDLTNISDVRLEPRNHNINTKQSQTGFNSSSMVEHLPQPHPSQ